MCATGPTRMDVVLWWPTSLSRCSQAFILVTRCDLKGPTLGGCSGMLWVGYLAWSCVAGDACHKRVSNPSGRILGSTDMCHTVLFPDGHCVTSCATELSSAAQGRSSRHVSPVCHRAGTRQLHEWAEEEAKPRASPSTDQSLHMHPLPPLTAHPGQHAAALPPRAACGGCTAPGPPVISSWPHETTACSRAREQGRER
jgi:hypothetical protein